ncbi:3-phosphoshikimate 1-carboxyvinyltransferase [Brevibacterium samyangense]|uniref:3-phosphoshikimate 1-carboxyvinyltransferase n=1 Tax=Brevibacterium samyangense TaxID=366888 RepID=A0ABP5EMT2_9MICO
MPDPAAPTPAPWSAPVSREPLRSTVLVPGSKSLTNRYLVLAALASEPSVVRNPLVSRDTTLMVNALRALGAWIDDSDPERFLVTPLGTAEGDDAGATDTREDASVPAAPLTVDCGLAGTVMRFVPPVAAVTGRTVRFDGDPEAYVRPMTTVLDALRALGVEIAPDATSLPFDLRAPGGVRGGHLEIDASASSQFVSGLLLAAGAFDLGLDLTHTGAALPSRPHIDMTLEVLADAGVHVSEPDPGHWIVDPGRPRGLDVVVEPDLSNAATFVAGALVTGGTVHIPHWPLHTTQAGDAFRDIAEAFGARAVLDQTGLTVTGPDHLRAVDLDLGAVGELTPVVAAVAACTEGSSYLRGIGHLRGHETDRLDALTRELRGLGATVDEFEDSLAIHSPATTGNAWETYHDHRMVMAGAVLGLRVPGVEILDPGTVAKTMPTFRSLWTEDFLGGTA